VRRTGGAAAVKSEEYIFIARARHAATTFSDTPSNRSAGRPIAFTRPSLAISASSVSSWNDPGSSFSSCRKPRRPPAGSPSSPSSSNSSSLPAEPSGSRLWVQAVKSLPNSDSASPSTRSIWPGAGGSIRSSRHRASSAARSRSREVSIGHMSVDSHTASPSSSCTVALANLWKSRTCLRWLAACREVKS
jgi:hypothetical protein